MEVISIKELIDNIIEYNKKLFGENAKYEKVNVGFTNTIYIVNDIYIVKICINRDNEKSFEKEINFYKSNINNNLIPKLYYSNTYKKDIPYYYEIIEKIEGVSLYNIWHTLTEEQREEIIKQLCGAMEQFHNNIGKYYNWSKKISDSFIEYFNKAKLLKLLNNEEIELLNKAYSKFDELLKSDEFVLVHNDLHFDNIFYNNGKIKLIDFERSLYAPKDFELSIIYRMVKRPWKYATEENEQYTKEKDYENIMTYIEKYYPELIHIDNLYKRLAIYDVVYYLRAYVKEPKYIENKEDALNAAKIVVEE